MLCVHMFPDLVTSTGTLPTKLPTLLLTNTSWRALYTKTASGKLETKDIFHFLSVFVLQTYCEVIVVNSRPCIQRQRETQDTRICGKKTLGKETFKIVWNLIFRRYLHESWWLERHKFFLIGFMEDILKEQDHQPYKHCENGTNYFFSRWLFVIVNYKT